MAGFRKYPKEGTIGRLVLKALEKNPKITVEDLTARVLAKHPQSKFKQSHLSWYKYQVKKGNYLAENVDVPVKKNKNEKATSSKK